MRNKLVFFLSLIVSNIFAAQSETSFDALQFSFQDHLILTNKKNPLDSTLAPEQFLLHENRLGFETGSYRFGVHISNQLSLGAKADRGLKEKAFTLEKKTLLGEWQHWDFKLGDSHQEIGKGIALSLYQDDVFGVNNTLEGISGKYHTKSFEAYGLGGRINSIQAPVAVYALENPLKNRNVYLIGGGMGFSPAPDTKISGHYVLALNQPERHSGFDKTWTTVGITAQQSNLIPHTEIYAELNTLFSHINVAGVDKELSRGWGAYTSLSWAENLLKLKWEGKFYEDYFFEFRRPPTLEEDVVETINLSQVAASRWAGDYRLSEGKGSVGGSYLLGYDKASGNPFHHWVGNTKWKVMKGFDTESKLGYRQVPEKSWMGHGSVKAKLKTMPGQFVELGYRKQYTTTKLSSEILIEDRNAIDLSYSFSERLLTTLGLEYLPQNTVELGQYFANVSATYRTGALNVKAQLGQTSGGTLCSGGVCRQVPPFSGGLVETTYSF